MKRPVASLLLASIVALGACSGSDGQVSVTGPDPVTVPPSTEAPDTTEPASTATDVTTPDSQPDTTTSTSTTSTTTEPAPDTTLDPIAEIEAEIKQTRLDGEAAYFAAAANPSDEQLRETYRTFYGADAFVGRQAFLDSLVANGTNLRSSTETPKEITFPGRFELTNDSTALLRECRVDTDVIRIPPRDGLAEVIVDDRIVATLSDVRYERSGDRWIIVGGDQVMRWEGRTSCVE